MAKKKTTVKKTATKKKPLAKRKAKAEPKVLKLKKRPKGPKALQAPKTRRLAIHAFCRECMYDPSEPGGWRGQIEKCTATNCPLYNFRPMTISAERAKAAKKRSQR